MTMRGEEPIKVRGRRRALGELPDKKLVRDIVAKSKVSARTKLAKLFPKRAARRVAARP
jgi:hypothetical protein